MGKIEVWEYAGCIVALTNGDTFKSKAVRYDIHGNGVLVWADRERTTFAPGAWQLVRMVVKPC